MSNGPDAGDVTVEDDQEGHRYVALIDGEVAGFAAYRRDGDRVVFTHTEVDDRYEGRGVGSRLAAGALDDVRARGLGATPKCSFIADYIERHPAHADLVVP